MRTLHIRVRHDNLFDGSVQFWMRTCREENLSSSGFQLDIVTCVPKHKLEPVFMFIPCITAILLCCS